MVVINKFKVLKLNKIIKENQESQKKTKSAVAESPGELKEVDLQELGAKFESILELKLKYSNGIHKKRSWFNLQSNFMIIEIKAKVIEHVNEWQRLYMARVQAQADYNVSLIEELYSIQENNRQSREEQQQIEHQTKMLLQSITEQ